MNNQQLVTRNRFVVADPLVVYQHVHRAYEEYKHKYQDYDPAQQKAYEKLYKKLGNMYQTTFRMENSSRIVRKLHQEVAQFMLELEFSPYLKPNRVY